MVMCDMAYTPHMRKRNFSSCIRTWKLRDPASISQLQLSCKVKTIIFAAAVGTAAGADDDWLDWICLMTIHVL